MKRGEVRWYTFKAPDRISGVSVTFSCIDSALENKLFTDPLIPDPTYHNEIGRGYEPLGCNDRCLREATIYVDWNNTDLFVWKDWL